MKLKKKFHTILLMGWVILLHTISFSQIKNYTFEQMDSIQKVDRRNVVVFIHADWCLYCQIMQNTTFKNDRTINKLNNEYYFIDLNAEEKKSIVFNRLTFNYKSLGTNTGIHELAEQLATVDEMIVYPTLCFLNPNNEIIFQYNQFINSSDLEIIMTRIK